MAARWSEAELPLFSEPQRINDPDRVLSLVAKEAEDCTRCPLYLNATQTVFGEGSAHSRMILVGEQPGDQEDLAGRPFVGPAGKVLDKALAAAGVPRDEVYITNAVKHFKNEPRGKRRIHKKPDTSEIEACRWWLDREITIIQPRLIVAMGATAARAITGKTTAIGKNRGRVIELEDSFRAVITIHPSYLLRLRDKQDKIEQFDLFVQDLRFAAEKAQALPAA